MKRAAGIWVLCCLLTLWGHVGESQDNKPDLELKLNVMTLGQKTFYKLILVNISEKEQTVITKSLDKSTDYTRNKHQDVTFGYGNGIVKFQGIKLVSSFYSFHPVTLKPKEGTILEISSKAFPVAFRKLNEAKTIKVNYEIAEKWAKRHKTWSGKVSTQTFTVKDGKIVIPEK